MAGWTSPLHLLREEFQQRRDEGCQIPDHLRQAAAMIGEEEAWSPAVDRVYDALMALEPDPALAAQEPNDLAAIRAARPEGPRDLRWQPSADELVDRLHGAWIGRCVGCALGKPVEGMGMSRAGDTVLSGRATIRRYLQARQQYPLTDYISGRDAGDGLTIGCPASQLEYIAYMEGDDDIHYSLTGLGVLEQYGPDFTWRNIGCYWLAHMPIAWICTAETQAITNLQLRSCRGFGGPATPTFTRRHRNPYREWIGAQIRADGWAWCCAGKPELAAEFAWRDAHWTHERNGIYGEMCFAAMQAAAFVESDPRRLVEIGLSEIPRDCRLARWARTCLGWIDHSTSFEACMERLEAALPDMHAVHTINNALVCLIALHYGALTLERTPAIAVMCGLDTDCNGATVGSIVGARLGRSRCTGPLVERLHDTIKADLRGFQQVTMTELATRTAAQWRRVDAYHRARQGTTAVAKAGWIGAGT